MPRIDAPTVVEHHARQRRAILDAARQLLGETGTAPSMAAVGRRTRLARSSLYQYFSSPEELLSALVADVFPDWEAQVHRRMLPTDSPGERIWGYVEGNLDLFASSEQEVARALILVVEPQQLERSMAEFHARLQVPLREALADLGEPEPAAQADLIDSLIVQASRGQADEHPSTAQPPETPPDCPTETARQPDAARERLRRLLGPYLGLAPRDT